MPKEKTKKLKPFLDRNDFWKRQGFDTNDPFEVASVLSLCRIHDRVHFLGMLSGQMHEEVVKLLYAHKVATESTHTNEELKDLFKSRLGESIEHWHGRINILLDLMTNEQLDEACQIVDAL